MFILSVVAEWALIRHRRRENRYGPSPTNEYTEGSAGTQKKGGFFRMLFGKKNKAAEPVVDPANQLPEHTQPDELRNSYATDQTRVGTSGVGAGAGAYEAPKYESYRHEGIETGVTGAPRREGWDDVPLAQYPPANYRYSDGVYERV